MMRTWQAGVVAGLLALVVVPAGRPAAEGQRPQEFVDPRTVLPAITGEDYVCNVNLYPPGMVPTYGDLGYLFVHFYGAANCQGQPVGTAFVFSKGATTSLADSRYLVSEAMLDTYLLMLQRAAGTGQKVYWVRCSSTKTNCLAGLGAHGSDAP